MNYGEYKEMRDSQEVFPPHLRDDASHLQCSKCGRKSWGGETINAKCDFLQPSGDHCDGIMEGLSA